MDPNERKEELTGKSHIVRLYEANCGIQFPTDADLRLRDALGNRIVRDYGLVVKPTPPTRSGGQPAGRS